MRKALSFLPWNVPSHEHGAWKKGPSRASFGVLLLMLYWTAHMDWPYIENTNNLIVDYHIVYSVVLIYLIVKRAGHVWGLDAWAEKSSHIAQHPALKPLIS